MVMALDITERRRSERELRRAFDAERAAAIRLRSLDEMKSTFLNAVSHELRTPLQSVLGGALTLQRLDQDLPDEDRRQLLDGVVTNAERLQRMLLDLLDLDRLSRGAAQLRRAPEELGGLVRRIVEHGEFGHEHPILMEPHPMVFPVDAPKVERIVENAGPGIPQEERATVFEPFHQGANRSTHAPGVGIGLSLVARFAELHGGRAWVDDRDGGGAAFRVLLRDPADPVQLPAPISGVPG